MKISYGILALFAFFFISTVAFGSDSEEDRSLYDSEYDDLISKSDADPDDDPHDNEQHHRNVKNWWNNQAEEIYAGIYGDDAHVPAEFKKKAEEAFHEVMSQHKVEHHSPKTRTIIPKPKPTPTPTPDPEKVASDNDHFHQEMHDWWKQETENIHKLVYGDQRMPLKYRSLADRYFRHAMKEHLQKHHQGDHVPFMPSTTTGQDGSIIIPPAEAQIDFHNGENGDDWDPFAPPKHDGIMSHLPPWMNGTATNSDSDWDDSEPDADDAWGVMSRMPHWMLGKRTGKEGRRWKYPMPGWLSRKLSGKRNYRHNLPKWMEYYSNRKKRHCYYRHGAKHCDSKYYRKYRPNKGYDGRPRGVPRRYKHRHIFNRKKDERPRCVKIKGRTFCTPSKKSPPRRRRPRPRRRPRKPKKPKKPRKPKRKYTISRKAKRVSDLKAWLRKYRRRYHAAKRYVARNRRNARRGRLHWRARQKYRRHSRFVGLYHRRRRELSRIAPRRRYRLSQHRRHHARLHAWLKQYRRYYATVRRRLRQMSKTKRGCSTRKCKAKKRRYKDFVGKYHAKLRELRNYHRGRYGYYPRLRFRSRRRRKKIVIDASKKKKIVIKAKKRKKIVIKAKRRKEKERPTLIIKKIEKPKKDDAPVVIDLTKKKQKPKKKSIKKEKLVVVDMTGQPKKKKATITPTEPVVIVANPKPSEPTYQQPSNKKCEMADSIGFCTFAKLCKEGLVGPTGQGGCPSGERCCVYKSANKAPAEKVPEVEAPKIDEKKDDTPDAPTTPEKTKVVTPPAPAGDRKKCMSGCFKKYPPFGLKDDQFDDDPMVMDTPSSTSTTSESDSDDASVEPKSSMKTVKVKCENKCALKIAQLKEKMTKQGGGTPSEDTIKRVKDMCLKMDKCEKVDEKDDDEMIRDVDVGALPEQLKGCILAC